MNAYKPDNTRFLNILYKNNLQTRTPSADERLIMEKNSVNYYNQTKDL